jgi:GTPase SAR1 family protein
LEKDLEEAQSENENLNKETEEQKQKIRNFDLVSDALKAEPTENKFIKEFGDLIEHDYKIFCDKEKGSNDAANIRKLDQILKEMRLIANCPELHSKSIGAIGGGFSSGKSSLINSFIVDAKIKLAEGITYVTAFPSYVICDQKSEVNGVSFRGGLFPIAPDIYKEISHDFIKSFDFDLKKIIEYTTVLAPMENQYFENLCIIDTPGYNAPTTGNTEYDFAIAKKYIENAEFLIWAVRIEEGTIPESDIEFLIKLNKFGIDPKWPLYVVANRAQLRKADDRENILDNIEETLDDNDLSYAGISAYNSSKKELLTSRKKDLLQFLEEHNKPSRVYVELRKMLNDVFSDYFKEANRDYDEREKKRKEVKKLILQAFAGGNINIDDDESSVDLESGLNDLLKYFQPKELKDERLKRIENLRDSFLNCLDSFCDDAGIDRKKDNFCERCGEPVENNSKLCSKCLPKTCPYCGCIKNKAKDKFCAECGKGI